MTPTDNSVSQTAPGRRNLLFHVHTYHSVDSLMKPRQIIAYARRAGIDAVIVTDHDSHLGSAECARLAGPEGPYFPMAAEYKTDDGEIIAAFLSQPIAIRDVSGIIQETHAQGGLVILPHPFRSARFADAIFEQCDLIEVFNARTSDADNERAAALADELGKPALAGADAHLPRELGLARNEFDVLHEPDDWQRILISAPRRFQTRKTSARNAYASQMIKGCRERDPLLLAKGVVRWTLGVRKR